MAEYTIGYINHEAKYNTQEFIETCERDYCEEVERAAQMIAACSTQKPIALVNGPSSSGKTTTTGLIRQALKKKGIRAHMLSMDDYYRTKGSYEMPFDYENNVPDLESPECMNLPLLSQHLSQIAAGEEVLLPRFDFENKVMYPNDRTLRLGADEIVLIEGIHAFNPVIMGDLAHMATGVYLSVASSVILSNSAAAQGQMLRFLRRAMRDSLFRGSPVEETLMQWKSVMRGEKHYIQPFYGQANIMIDTFLPYEVLVLAGKLKASLRGKRDALAHAGLAPLMQLLEEAETIEYEKIMPQNSVLHEFIG